MPSWGDLKDHNGNPLPGGEKFFAIVDQIAYEIGKNLRFWRVPVMQTKEKWGEVRVYCRLGWYQLLHDIFYPGYVYCQWNKWYNKWLWDLDFLILKTPVVSWLNKIILPFHSFIYKRAYKKIVLKYPEFKDYIIKGADFRELLQNI